MLMALYPDIQEKLFSELQNVFSSVDEEVTEDHLKNLTYMDCVIKEAMRFWTVIPNIARSASEDFELGG